MPDAFSGSVNFLCGRLETIDSSEANQDVSS